MTELIVVGFEGVHRASEVLYQLQRMESTWTIDLQDAVAVYRTWDGRLRVDQSYQPTSRDGAAWGGLVGGLLGGLLAAPFTMGASVALAAGVVGAGALSGGVVGAAVGAEDAADWKAEFGISEDFVEEVGGMVQPNQSAVFMLARTADPEAVAAHFHGYGGKIIRTTLSPEKAEQLQRTLAAASAGSR
jgi:uncharacterized membrane protein